MTPMAPLPFTQSLAKAPSRAFFLSSHGQSIPHALVSTWGCYGQQARSAKAGLLPSHLLGGYLYTPPVPQYRIDCIDRWRQGANGGCQLTSGHG